MARPIARDKLGRVSVSIMLIRVLTDAVEAAGVDRAQWLVAAKFDPRRLEDSNGRVSVDEYDRLRAVALELSGDPALGLHLGEASDSAAYDVIGHLAAHASTLRHALETIMRFGAIIDEDGTNWTLEERGDAALVSRRFPQTSLPAHRMFAEFAISGFMRLIRQLAGPKASARRAYFQHPAPEYKSEYTRIFGGTESFDHPFTGIEFDYKLLDLPPPHVHPELYAVLEHEAERRLARLTGHLGYAERTREYLVARLLELQPDMAAVARHLGVSVRTLRRRLSEEGVTYADLIEQAQAIVAKRMLGDTRRSIHETAYAMGFADPSGFHRAFKRWTGQTPSEFRGAR
jgi:AraC-like DNA-binding protein